MTNNLDALERELTSAPSLRPLQSGATSGNEKSPPSLLFSDDVPTRTAPADTHSGKMRAVVLLAGVFMVLAVGALLWYVYRQGVLSGAETAAPVLRPDGPAKVQPGNRDALALGSGNDELGDETRIYERIDGEIDSPDLTIGLQPPEETPILPSNNSMRGTGNEAGLTERQQALRQFEPDENAFDPNDLERTPPPPSIVDPQSNETIQARQTQPQLQPSTASVEPKPPAIEEPQLAEPTELPRSQQTDIPKEVMELKENEANGVAAIPSAGAAWRIQIAALGSQDEATRFWQATRARFPDLFQGLTFSMEQTLVNGKDYFRVRGGPLPDQGTAERFCANLMAQGQACIIVKPNQ